MTIPRFLLISGLLVGSVVAFLSLAPLQTGKWVFIWQAYALPVLIPGEEHLVSDTHGLPSNYTGTWNTWYPDGHHRASGEYLNGMRHGQVIRYYRNGILSTRGSFVQGNETGLVKSFDRSGKLIWMGDYSRDDYHFFYHYSGTRLKLLQAKPVGNYRGSVDVFSESDGIDRRAEFGVSTGDNK